MHWLNFWEKKAENSGVTFDEGDLEALVAMDGFDHGCGKLTGAQFKQIAAFVKKELNLAPGMSLLEVGCGSGALLFCLRECGLKLYGVDYSPASIQNAKIVIPEGEFAVAEASQLPFTADAIVCHSVFQYFPDLDYAKKTVEGFRQAAPNVLIMDIPDLKTREESERVRAAAGSVVGKHLFYPRSFFAGATIMDNELKDYGNAPFRFHALYRN